MKGVVAVARERARQGAVGRTETDVEKTKSIGGRAQARVSMLQGWPEGS